jgi:lipopolysaccharide export system protein LptC
MALLAALSWWLVKQAPKADGPQRIDVPSHTVDYEMRGFSVRHQGGHGLAASLVQGDQVRHFADDDTLEIAGVYLRSSDGLGRLTEAWAERAQMDAQARHLVLQGRARVRRSLAPGGAGPIEFTSEWLAVDTQAERMHTDRPVTLVQGAHRFDADGLDYDHARDELVLSGPVHGRIDMRPR